MQYVAIIGVLILLAFSGGVSGGSGLASSSSFTSTQSASVAGASTSSASQSTQSTTNETTRGSGWFSRNPYATTYSYTNRANEVSDVSYQVPSIETLPVLNVEDTSATFRADVNMFTGKDGVAFVVYGYDLNSVRRMTSGYDAYDQIPDAVNDKARTAVFSSRASGNKEYTKRVASLVPDAVYYYKVCVEYETLIGGRAIDCASVRNFETNNRYNQGSYYRVPSVSMSRVTNITGNSAELNGRVTMRDAEDGIVFLVYGENEALVRAVDSFEEYSDIDEYDEELQKVRLGVAVLGEAEYAKKIEDLENDTTHYYRLCVQYDGERDGIVCSSVGRFTTDERNRSVAPFVKTGGYQFVTDGVKISGSVQMNRYRDGVAFMVIGKNLDRVVAVADASSFARIRQSGLDLQKIELSSDLDTNRSFTATVSFLEAGIYYYRTCVQYEDENEYNRTVDTITCGDVEVFTRY